MPRTHYRNGDELERSNGGCDECEVAMINGVFCHETGCLSAYKDKKIDCNECGYGFYPSNRFIGVCDDCLENINREYAEEEADDDDEDL